MNTEQLQTLEIPLSRLLAWNDNVRTNGVEEGIGELADSIAAVGLLQGLVVKKEPRGKYAVIAGRRRLLALSQLAEGAKVKPSMPVPCRLAPKDADLPEISLTENVMRVPMHPADEFEAFQRLVTAGKAVADVAARFGVTEAVVMRRLALARVSPLLLAKYREGELNLELLQAFTLTDDHQAQEDVWSKLQPWDRKPHTVREMLASEDIPASDKRVRFAGLKEYEAAGGHIGATSSQMAKTDPTSQIQARSTSWSVRSCESLRRTRKQMVGSGSKYSQKSTIKPSAASSECMRRRSRYRRMPRLKSKASNGNAIRSWIRWKNRKTTGKLTRNR